MISIAWSRPVPIESVEEAAATSLGNHSLSGKTGRPPGAPVQTVLLAREYLQFTETFLCGLPGRWPQDDVGVILWGLSNVAERGQAQGAHHDSMTALHWNAEAKNSRNRPASSRSRGRLSCRVKPWLVTDSRWGRTGRLAGSFLQPPPQGEVEADVRRGLADAVVFRDRGVEH